MRPTLLSIDPAHDGFYRTKLTTDSGLSLEIRQRVRQLEEQKVKPSCQAFA